MLKLPLKKNIGISLLTNLIPPGDIYKEAQVKKYVEVIENKVDNNGIIVNGVFRRAILYTGINNVGESVEVILEDETMFNVVFNLESSINNKINAVAKIKESENEEFICLGIDFGKNTAGKYFGEYVIEVTII